MGFEIDFLPVGEGSTSGDAIAMRYGNLYGARYEQTVIVVDGGFSDDGEALIEHLDNYYDTDRADYVICSHPDRDHVGGLRVVLEELEVAEFWMHLPWNHSSEMAIEKARTGFRSTHLATRVEAALQGATLLEEIALTRGIPMREPFLGLATHDEGYYLLGPSEDFYEEQLELFSDIPEKPAAAAGLLTKAAEALTNLVEESDVIETLTNAGSTSPQNNTSAIGLLRSDEQMSLLTADAGIPALEHAVEVLEGAGYQPGGLNFIQVPHHGSKRNVGPAVLNRLLGEKGATEVRGAAIVSAAPDGRPKHPAKKVTNAFRRRGYLVAVTEKVALGKHVNAPDRSDWSPAETLPLYAEVEDDDG